MGVTPKCFNNTNHDTCKKEARKSLNVFFVRVCVFKTFLFSNKYINILLRNSLLNRNDERVQNVFGEIEIKERKKERNNKKKNI